MAGDRGVEDTVMAAAAQGGRPGSGPSASRADGIQGLRAGPSLSLSTAHSYRHGVPCPDTVMRWRIGNGGVARDWCVSTHGAGRSVVRLSYERLCRC